MLITITKYDAFNSRRYSNPWAAKLALNNDNLAYDFCGTYTGYNGTAGDLLIDAAPGTVIAWGQRDHKGGKTDRQFGEVEEDGTIKKLAKSEAIKILYAGKEPTP